MATQVNIVSVQAVGQQLRVAFNLVLTGSYVTGGDTVDFTKALQDTTYVGLLAGIESSQGPISLDIWDAGGNIANTLNPVKGSAMNNSKLKIQSAFNTEFSAGAYSAGLLAAVIEGEAIFPKLL